MKDTMGGMMMDDDWEMAASNDDVRTVVLVGRTGNGKSATGNSILGRRVFNSKVSHSAVTSTCELQRTVLGDGQVVNVIDTPGLFEHSDDVDIVGKEIVNCINLAKDGIHAVLVVFSVRGRWSKEEKAVLQSLQSFFGEKITDYMIVVLTNGDEFEDSEETFTDYLGHECEPLKKLLGLCKNRMVLFDNKTRDERKRSEQVQKLFSLVNMVVAENGGQPYTNEFFDVLKEEAVKLRDQKEQLDSLKGYSEQEITKFKTQISEEQLQRITNMVEMKLEESTQRLEQQLKEEQASRLKAEEFAQEAQKKSNDEIRQLRESLQKAQKETVELRVQAQKETEELREQARKEREQAQKETEELRELAKSGRCSIL